MCDKRDKKENSINITVIIVFISEWLEWSLMQQKYKIGGVGDVET